MPPPFRPSTAAPVGPNRGIVVSLCLSTIRDASGGTPATQAVAHIKRGQGADREAPVAAVENANIVDGVGATRHEAVPHKGIVFPMPGEIRIDDHDIGGSLGQGHIGRCVGRVLGGRDRPQVKGSDRRPGPCVDDLGRNGDAADRVVGDAQQASQHRPIHYIGQPKRQIGVGDIGIQVTTGDGVVCAPRPTGRWALKPVAGYGRLCPDRPGQHRKQ